MRKTDKAIEKEIIQRLTDLCETMKPQLSGFIWLTHHVNYRRFPASLQVTLVFDDRTPETILWQELAQLLPLVQAALKPVVGGVLPAKQIEARREQTLH